MFATMGCVESFGVCRSSGGRGCLDRGKARRGGLTDALGYDDTDRRRWSGSYLSAKGARLLLGKVNVECR
jgi:hypothetical protein